MITEHIKEIFFEHYREFYEPIEMISFDSANDETPSHLPYRMFNFDEITADVYRVGNELLPCSTDGFFVAGGKLYFLEFKNGKLNSQEKKRDLRLKFAEAPYVVLARILKKHKYNVTRKDFYQIPKIGIVVYNQGKNPGEVLNTRFQSRFQLDEYTHILYDKVFTFSFKQFDKLVRKGLYPFNTFEKEEY